MLNIDNIGEKIFRDLESEDYETRQRAIELITSVHEPDIYQAVISYLSSEDAIVRNAAIEILTKWGANVVPLLVEKIDDPSSNIRLYVSNILGDIGDPQAVDALLSMLPDEESNVRFAAAEAIGKIGSKSATMPLLHYLNSKREEPWEQFPLILTLGQLQDERAVIPLLQLSENEMLQQPILQAISNIADEHAIPYILEVLKSPDTLMQNMAILAIQNMREKIKKYQLGEDNFKLVIQNQFKKLTPIDQKLVLENLRNRLDEKDYTIKLGAIFIIGLSGSRDAFEILVKSFSPDFMPEIEDAMYNIGKNHPEVLTDSLYNNELACRDIIIRLIGQLKLENAANEIIKNMEHPLPEVRTEAAIASGNLEITGAIPYLITLLKDPLPEIQNSAIKALHRFEAGLVLPVLTEGLTEKSNDEEILIIKVLSGLKPPVPSAEILKFAKSSSQEVRKIIAQALKNYDDDETSKALLRFVSDVHPHVREEAIRSLEGRGEKVTDALITSLNDQAPWVRYCAAKALGKQKLSENLLNSISALLSDPIPFVQIAVIESLGKLKAESFSEKILEFVSNPDPDISQAAILSLSSFNSEKEVQTKFLALLEKQIENPNWIIRKAIATALGRLKLEESVDLLLRMLAQENENIVDKEILESLSKLGNYSQIIPLLIFLTNEKNLREATLDVLASIGKDAIPYLQKSLDNEDPDIRVNIVSILARIDEDKSIQTLVKLVSVDSSPNVRKQAVLALNNFKTDQRSIWAVMWAANHDADELVKQTAKAILVS